MDALLADPKATARALDCADARESLHAFCGVIEIPGAPLGAEDDEAADALFSPIETPPAAHHRKLIDLCERLERGETRRAMVFMPPGSAKSTYASVVFPAWAMGRKRRRNIILGTYASDLARKMGRRMRSVVRQPVYREIFDTGLSAESSAADEWALENGNEFMAGGILSGITGNRADGFVVDDPVKNRQDADSEIIQKRTKEEYDATILSRLKPNGWVLLIQTRWNENDLAGQILPEGWDGESGNILCRDGLVWEVLCIPAEAEQNDPLGRKPGEMLWPEWFGLDPIFWTAQRQNVRNWSALYQQRPTPLDGTFFQRAWFKRYRIGEEPAHLRNYLTSDHAPTDGADSDPSGCRVWGIAPNSDIYLRGGFNHRATMDVTADRIVGNVKTGGDRDPEPVPMEGLIRRYEPFAWFPEDDNNWKSVEPFILRQMKAEGVRTRIEAMSPHGHDKAAKAQSFQGLAAMGQVYIPVGPEGDEIIDQYVKFPAGKHDEEVDMAGIMGRAIAMAHPAIVPPEAPSPGEPKGITAMTFDQLMAAQKPKVERV